MKKLLLSATLASLLCTISYADDGDEPSTTPPPPIETASPSVAINCNYNIPSTTKTIDETVVSIWARKAAIQSFEFEPNQFDKQITALKACYTDEGWRGFHDALEKSGNMKSIRSQSLNVTSQISGNLTINPLKDNQWKVNLPLQVVYQNNKEQLTQLLMVDLLIGRKVNGNLGIMQIIAIPRNVVNS